MSTLTESRACRARGAHGTAARRVLDLGASRRADRRGADVLSAVALGAGSGRGRELVLPWMRSGVETMEGTAVAEDGSVWPVAAGQRIRVLTGNLLSGGVGRGKADGRFEDLMRVAKQQDPDIALLQECLFWDADDYRLFHRAEQVLGMRGLLGLSPLDQHVAIFVREPLTVTAHRSLPDRVWHHGALMAQVSYPRAAGEFGSITVASAHLSARSPEQRLLEAEQLVDYVRHGGWAVIGGDMNTADPGTDLSLAPPRARAGLAQVGTDIPDTRCMTRLADAGFVDAAVHAERAVPTTGHWRGQHFAARPDRIFLSERAAAALTAVRLVTEVADYSDHLWLTADLHVGDAVFPEWAAR